MSQQEKGGNGERLCSNITILITDFDTLILYFICEIHT